MIEIDPHGRNLPKYRCHKDVWAVKIASIAYDLDSALITPADPSYPAFRMSGEWIGKHNPQVGGYFVVYEDGYRSYSPAKAFEEGYTRV